MAAEPGEIQQQQAPPGPEQAKEKVSGAPETTLKLAGESDTDALKRTDVHYREATKPHIDHGNKQVAVFVKAGQNVGLTVA